MSNIEIKAKVTDLKQVMEKAEMLSGQEAIIIKQHDIFYNVPNGRLKLRRFVENGEGELIFYERPNNEGPKLSTYEKISLQPPSVSSLNDILLKALGAKIDVKKTRHVFLVDQTRVHVDEVEGLGSFMELEVCLRPEQLIADGVKIANDLMEKLEIQKKDLVSGAYADLIINDA